MIVPVHNGFCSWILAELIDAMEYSSATVVGTKDAAVVYVSVNELKVPEVVADVYRL